MTPQRTQTIKRKTAETDITIELNLDGTGISNIETPIGFFSHMLTSFAKHGLFDLTIKVTGDIDVDQHHTIEDTGIALGEAFRKALGNKSGINRAGFFIYPMDDALATSVVDLGGRTYCTFSGDFKRRFCGELDLDLLEDFFQGFASAAKANVIVEINRGRDDHHKVEALFKSFAKAMLQACSVNPRIRNTIPSTKGVL